MIYTCSADLPSRLQQPGLTGTPSGIPPMAGLDGPPWSTLMLLRGLLWQFVDHPCPGTFHRRSRSSTSGVSPLCVSTLILDIVGASLTVLELSLMGILSPR